MKKAVVLRKREQKGKQVKKVMPLEGEEKSWKWNVRKREEGVLTVKGGGIS